jgi:hypothetical protein
VSLGHVAVVLWQQGGDILMHGFGPVAQTLMKNGLLDVLHL